MNPRCTDCTQPLLPNPDPKPHDEGYGHTTCWKCSMKRARFLFPALRGPDPLRTRILALLSPEDEV